jgi:hypothetical protein
LKAISEKLDDYERYYAHHCHSWLLSLEDAPQKKNHNKHNNDDAIIIIVFLLTLKCIVTKKNDDVKNLAFLSSSWQSCVTAKEN